MVLEVLPTFCQLLEKPTTLYFVPKKRFHVLQIKEHKQKNIPNTIPLEGPWKRDRLTRLNISDNHSVDLDPVPSNTKRRHDDNQNGRAISPSDKKRLQQTTRKKEIRGESLHERTQEGKNRTTNSAEHTLEPFCYIYRWTTSKIQYKALSVLYTREAV